MSRLSLASRMFSNARTRMRSESLARPDKAWWSGDGEPYGSLSPDLGPLRLAFALSHSGNSIRVQFSSLPLFMQASDNDSICTPRP